MSVTVCTYPIVGAVRKADDILGPDRIWSAVRDNKEQIHFLHRFYSAVATAEVARIPELESIASRSHTEINRWLAERKFNITLDRFPPDGFGAACMLDVAVAWLVTGDVRPLTLGTRAQVPGVFLKEGVSFFTSALGVGARIETKNGDIVRMIRNDNPKELEGLDLAELFTGLRQTIDNGYAGIHFPMVDIDQQPDISWLLRMSTTDADGDPWFIAQAKQQTKFKMNQFGARVKSGVAIGLLRSSVQRPKPPLIIDGPFFLWIQRPGLSRPFFVAHITPEDMKDPGDLANM